MIALGKYESDLKGERVVDILFPIWFFSLRGNNLFSSQGAGIGQVHFRKVTLNSIHSKLWSIFQTLTYSTADIHLIFFKAIIQVCNARLDQNLEPPTLILDNINNQYLYTHMYTYMHMYMHIHNNIFFHRKNLGKMRLPKKIDLNYSNWMNCLAQTTFSN